MAYEHAKVTYADLGPRDGDGYCFCAKLNARVYFDQRTWDVWEAHCFGGSADIRRAQSQADDTPHDWQIMLIHR